MSSLSLLSWQLHKSAWQKDLLFYKYKVLFNGSLLLQTRDEMSQPCNLFIVTWFGPNVSVMKKAKKSTTKRLLKEATKNLLGEEEERKIYLKGGRLPSPNGVVWTVQM